MKTVPLGIYSQKDLQLIRATLEQLWHVEFPNQPHPFITDEHLVLSALGNYRAHLQNELDEFRAGRRAVLSADTEL